jgi:hypothetical protein
MPTFFGYIFKFAVPILLPILIAVAFLFIGSRPAPKQLREVKPLPAAQAPAQLPASAQPPAQN